MEDHHRMAPLMEMSVFKIIETVFEAVPSSILQIYALLSTPEKSFDALLSILVSAATIAFTSSMLSYDWDTSPERRVNAPLFYGKLQNFTAASNGFSSLTNNLTAGIRLRS